MTYTIMYRTNFDGKHLYFIHSSHTHLPTAHIRIYPQTHTQLTHRITHRHTAHTHVYPQLIHIVYPQLIHIQLPTDTHT